MPSDRVHFLTLTEAGAQFGLSAGHLRVLVNRGRLVAEKRGRDWFVTPLAVKAYLTGRKEAGRRPSPTKQRLVV